MPPITRKGDFCTGHEACPARPAKEGEPTVTVSGQPVVRQGHAYVPHSYPEQAPHGGMLSTGAPYVTIGGYEVGRIGDAISCGGNAAQGEQRVTVGNLGGEDYAREIIFDAQTDEHSQLILCLEKIAEAESKRASERDKQGWLYFKSFMPKWLSKESYIIQDRYDPGGQEPSYVQWDWLMQFTRFSTAVDGMLKFDYLFSKAAMKKLTEVLHEDNAFEGSGKTFNYIDSILEINPALPWEIQYDKWKQLREDAFQSKSAGCFLFGLGAGGVKWTPLTPDGFQATVANVTILALAKGVTEVTAKGVKRIHLREVAFYIWDGFEFEDKPDAAYSQWLGNWDCSNEKFSLISGKILQNKHFNDFRKRIGYGCDFRIISAPRIVWQGVCCYEIP